jgi:thiamine kinase-like enzyme
MRLLKLTIVSVVVIFLLMAGISSLFPSTIVVTRGTGINAPVDSVKQYIARFDEWNNWMEGAKGSDYKVVSKDSVHAYFGTVVITLLSQKNNDWQHEWKSRTFTQLSDFQIVPLSNGSCTIQWTFTQHIGWYPWAKIGSMMTEKIIGSSIEKSLSNLKALAEKTE